MVGGLMAIVSRVLGDCPGSCREDSCGNPGRTVELAIGAAQDVRARALRAAGSDLLRAND
jgi:hypothetical protein